MKKLIFLIAVSSVNSLAFTPYIAPSETLKQFGNQMKFETSYFLSNKKIDANKNKLNYENDEKFQSYDVAIKGSYGFTKHLQGNIGANFRENQSFQLINGQVQKEKVNGPESFSVGVKYNWPRDERMQFALIGEYYQRMYSVQRFQNINEVKGLTLGDDGPLARFGLTSSYLTKSKNFISANLFYQNPGIDLSSEILTEIEYAINWKKVAAYLGLQRITSLKQDPYAGEAELKPQIAKGNSELYNSVNRESSSIYSGINFSIGDKWAIAFKGIYTFDAVSSDLGTKVSFSLIRRSEVDDTFKKADSSFKQYQLDGVVKKVGNTKKVVVIDKGLDDGVYEGMQIDFFFFDYLGGNDLIAVGKVIKASSSTAIVKIVKKYSKKMVQSGTLFRGGLIKNNE